MTAKTREDRPNVQDIEHLPDTPSSPTVQADQMPHEDTHSATSPKPATVVPHLVEEQRSSPEILDSSPVESPKPHTPRHQLNFTCSPVITIRSPSAGTSHDICIIRRELTRLVSNMYFSTNHFFLVKEKNSFLS